MSQEINFLAEVATQPEICQSMRVIANYSITFKIFAAASLSSGNMKEAIAATLAIQKAIAYARNILIPESPA